MKKQITRFSPHQNAKVFAILMALGSLVFLVPFMLFASTFGPKEARIPWFLFVAFPVMYLIVGYICIAISCWFYNLMSPHIGGIEYEDQETE